MAAGMRVWAAAVVVLMVAILRVALPPRSMDEVQRGWRFERPTPGTAEEQQRNRLLRAVRTTNARLRAARWEDSLRPLVSEHGTRGVYLGLPAPDGSPEEEAWVRSILAREIPAEDPGRAAVGVVFLASGASSYPGATAPRLGGYFFGADASGTPYCFAVRAQGGPPGDARLALPWGLSRGDATLTGICRWVHRYGLPGSGVRRWLEEGGADPGAAADTFDGPLVEVGGSEAAFRRRGILGLPGGASLLLRGVGTAGLLPPVLDRCLAGDADACEASVLREEVGPRGRRGSMEARFTAVDSWSSWRPERHLLATLEARFGPERFTRFWHSETPVPEAFEEAFGRPMGGWLLEWYGEHTDIVPPGPAPDAAGLLGSLGVLLLAGLLASLFVRRWRVSA